MKAAVLHDFKDLAKNLAIETRALPSLKPGQVLIRMSAASINPSDLVFLRQQYGIQKPLPVIPGFEGSGIVVATNAGLYGRWLLGKHVACHAPHDGDGTWAEYMACSTGDCIPLKKHITLEQGASLLVNPLTAWTLLKRIKHQGHRAFIQTAASSAVGRMMVRLARRFDIPAIHIVRRAEHIALLEKEGAVHVLNSTDTRFAETLQTLAMQVSATVALDAVGGSLTATVAAALPSGGEIIVYGALAGEPCQINPADFIFKRKSISGFWLTETFRQMSFLSKWTDLSRVQNLLGTDLVTHVQARYPLEHIQEALQLYKAKRGEGKVLLIC